VERAAPSQELPVIRRNQSDLLRPFPSDDMRVWPTTRVNKPENDHPSILDPIELATMLLFTWQSKTMWKA
jgi:hypothetical protein